MKNKTFLKKLLAVTMALAMVFSLTGVSFAEETEVVRATNRISVSVTQDNFDTSGNYIGGGEPYWFTVGGANIEIADFSKRLSYFDNKATTNWKRTYYLPAGVADPQGNKKASVLDAVIAACENKNVSVQSGWDTYSAPNGGYIHNLNNIPLEYNVEYYQGDNGNKWGHATGTGWQIAYKKKNTSNYIVSDIYLTGVRLEKGMKIIMDLSPFDMSWDTGEPWQ